MNRVDGMEINIYWSDLTAKAKEDILYKLSVAEISLSTLITNDIEPFAWTCIDKDGDPKEKRDK